MTEQKKIIDGWKAIFKNSKKNKNRLNHLKKFIDYCSQFYIDKIESVGEIDAEDLNFDCKI